MKKIITITEDEKGGIIFESKGFTNMETLGVLRFQEKNIWLMMQEQRKTVVPKSGDSACDENKSSLL